MSLSYILLHFYIRRIGFPTGWAILRTEAPYARDYLLPAPANNYRGFKRKELTYHTAFAVQSQIISLASYRGLRIFRTGMKDTATSCITARCQGIRGPDCGVASLGSYSSSALTFPQRRRKKSYGLVVFIAAM